MKKNHILNIFSILALLAIVTFSSCEDDEVAGSDEVVLLSFGPTGVAHGDEIVFIGQNLDKVTSVILKPAITIDRSQFIDASSGSFKIVIPLGAEAGKVMLNTSQGEIESKTVLSFKVDVEITSITSEAKPGTNITISGTLINWIESVTFASDITVEKEDFVSQSETDLVVTVPMEAQSGFLIFATGGTEPLTFAIDEELIVTLPVVTAIDPTSIRHEDNLTITGTDLDLVTEIIFSAESVVAADFVSQSETEIVVTVPATTETGTLTLKQLSPINVVTGELTIILPVGTNVTPVPAIPGVDNITITGTDLDLVGELELPGVGIVSTFISQTATEIVVAVSAEGTSGGIGYTTIHGYSGNLGVNLIVPGEGPPPLSLVLYDDEIFFGGGNWSWGASEVDPASTEQFYSGSISFKHVQSGGDGGASVGGMSGVNASGLGTFAFSLYGGPGTDGLSVAVILNDTWGNYNTVTMVEGQWTDYRLDFSIYPDVDFSNITRWIIKPEGTSAGDTWYVDRVGFDPAGPTPLPIELYDDVLAPGGGDWSWNTGVSDNANTEEVYSGSVSWKFETPSDGGVSSGGLNVDAGLSTYFSFSLFGGPGTDGAQVAAILNDNWGNYNSVTLVEGQWTEYQINLSNYPDIDTGAITRWIFKVEGMTGSTIYVDRVGFE